MDLASYIRNIPDFPKPGIQFKDITPLLANPEAFQEAIHLMAAHYRGRRVDAVAAAEARGFLFAAPLALAEGMLRGMAMTKLKFVTMLILAFSLVGGGAGLIATARSSGGARCRLRLR